MTGIYKQRLAVMLTVFLLSLVIFRPDSHLYCQTEKEERRVLLEEKDEGGLKALWRRVVPGREHLESLKSDIKEKDAEIETFTSEFAQLKDKYQSIVDNYSNLKQEYSKLLESVKQKDDSMDGLNEKLTDLRSQIEPLKQNLVSKEEELASLKKRSTQIEPLKQNLVSKEEELASLKERYATPKKKIRKLEDEIAEFKKARKTLNRDIKKKGSQIENLTKKFTRSTGELTQLTEEYMQLQKSVKDKDRTIKDLNKKILALTRQQKDMARSKQDKDAQVEKLTKKLTKLAEEITQLKDKNRLILADKKKVEVLLKKREKDIARLDDRSGLLKSIEEKDSTIADLKERLTDFMAIQKIEEKDQKVKLLLANIRKLSRQREETERALEEALEKNKKLFSIIEERKQGITNAKGIYEKGDLDAEIHRLREKNERYEVQNSVLKKELDTASEGYRIKLKQVGQLKDEIDIANLMIEELKRQNTSKQKVLGTTEKITEDLRHKVRGLERQRRKLVLEKKNIKEDMDREKLKMHYNLALYYDSGGVYREAEKEYLNALSIDPDDPEVHYNLGILYDDALNENKKAIYHYRRYLELRPMTEGSNKIKAWIVRAESDERLRRLAPEAFH